MRTIVAGLFVSLDGVTEAPENWQLPYVNDELLEAVGAGMAESDTILLGRRTYEEFAAYWPNQRSDVQLPQTPLELVRSRTFRPGVVDLTYRPQPSREPR
jgi:dihydrofolate reductase